MKKFLILGALIFVLGFAHQTNASTFCGQWDFDYSEFAFCTKIICDSEYNTLSKRYKYYFRICNDTKNNVWIERDVRLLYGDCECKSDSR